MTPVPPLKIPVRLDVPPGEIVLGVAVKPVIMGATGLTVTVTACVEVPPEASVTVRI
jgi:hypothetical protein